ncbi:MAG: hypothetical protein ACI4BD_00980 [Paludibacteraceae bacterium]
MKKTFTMILVVLLVGTTWAQSLEGIGLPALEKVTIKPRTQMTNHPKLALSPRQQSIAQKLSPQKAAKHMTLAEAIPDTIVIVPESFEPEWYEETKDWYWGFIDQSMQYFVALDWYGTPNSPFGTVTANMLDPDYSNITSYETFEQVTIEDGGFSVRQVKISKNLSAIKIAGELSGSDGNIYVLSGLLETLTPQDTISVAIPDATIRLDTVSTLLLIGTTDNTSVRAVIHTKQLTGNYASNEFDLDQVEVVVDGKAIDVWDIQASILANATYTALVADLTVLSKDTIVYALQLSQSVAIADTVSVSINNMQIDDSWGEYGMYFLYGSTTGIAIETVTSALNPDTYSMEEGSLAITLAVGSKMVEVLGGTVVLDENMNGDIFADVECLASNNNLYRLHMCWAVPTPVKTVVLEFPNRAVANIDTSKDIFQMIGTNEDASVAVGVQNWVPGKDMTLTAENVLLDYTAVARYVGGDTIVSAAAAVGGNLTIINDTLWMSAEIICFDSVQYDVRLWYAVPAPTETIELGEITDTKFVNAMATMGVYQLVGATADSTYTVAFCAVAPMDVEGEYENNGMFESNMMAQYTWIKEKATGKYLNVLQGKVTVTMDQATGQIIANGHYICDNEKQYNFTLKVQYESHHIAYDMQDTPVDAVFTADTHEFVVDTEYLSEGAVILEVIGKKNADYLILQFLLNPEDIDPQTTINEGDYPIDDSYVTGTVTAGDFNGTSIYPSFYGQITQQGISTKGLYFLVEGIVKVEKANESDLHIVVDAFNSYEVPMKIDINTSSTDMENVEMQSAKAIKFVKDGQLFIQRGEIIYSVLGNIVD